MVGRRAGRDAVAAALEAALPQKQIWSFGRLQSFRTLRLTFEPAAPFQAVRLLDISPPAFASCCTNKRVLLKPVAGVSHAAPHFSSLRRPSRR